MKSFFSKLFNSRKIRPPKSIAESFKQNFPKAVNVEWTKYENGFEAIFHENDKEKIVRYDISGALNETRTCLVFKELPEHINATATNYGELMNAIKIERPGDTFFEIIYRDTALIRYLLLLDISGNVILNEVL